MATIIQDVIAFDVIANQPAAGHAGYLFASSDETPPTLYRDNGTTWDAIADLGGGGGGGGALTERVRAYHTANQSIPNTTATTLAFNAERWDTDTCHDNVTNNSRLTCTTSGAYLIGVQILWDQGTTPSRLLVWILLNGTDVIAEHEIGIGSISTNPEICLTTQWDLTATDYVQVVVYQNSGGALNVVSAAKHSPEFWMMRVQ